MRPSTEALVFMTTAAPTEPGRRNNRDTYAAEQPLRPQTPKRHDPAWLPEQTWMNARRSDRHRHLPSRRRLTSYRSTNPNTSTSAIAQSGLQGFEQSAESVSNARSVTRTRRPSLSWPCAPPGCALHRLDGGLLPPACSPPPYGLGCDWLGGPHLPGLPKAPRGLRTAPHTIYSRGLSHTAARRHPCTGSPEF